MDARYILIIIMIGAFFGGMLYRPIWSCFDHSKKAKNKDLVENATIIDMESKRVQYTKNGAKFKTTVLFSDGFQFVTHRTNREDHVFTYQISVDTRVISMYAHRAHGRAFSKQEKRKERTAT